RVVGGRVMDVGAADSPARGSYCEVELPDGTVPRCGQVKLNGSRADLTVLPDLPASLPLSSVFTILRDAQEPKNRQEWQKFVAKRGQFDKVGVPNGDTIDGLDGTFGPGTGDGIEFTFTANGEKRNPKLAKVAGLVFAQRSDPNAPPSLCKVSDAAGNLLVAADVVLNGQGLAVTTASGVRVTYPDAQRLADLAFTNGKLRYLSAETPTKEGVTLATEDDAKYARFVRYRRDASLDNGPLRLNGTAHAKGLALHAGTQLAYDIGGDYKEFRTVLGVDESVET